MQLLMHQIMRRGKVFQLWNTPRSQKKALPKEKWNSHMCGFPEIHGARDSSISNLS